MKAESKRRVESNEVMLEYITDYLDQLQQSLNNRVNVQFHSLKAQIDSLEEMMTKIEQELEHQETDIKTIIQQRKEHSIKEIADADVLLKNLKGAYRVQKSTLNQEQELLIKEIQSFLKNDSMQWDQIKT